jgi:hypothetical protein
MHADLIGAPRRRPSGRGSAFADPGPRNPPGRRERRQRALQLGGGRLKHVEDLRDRLLLQRPDTARLFKDFRM